MDQSWLGTNLPGLREARGTYARFPLQSLPPIEATALDGTLSWLAPPTEGAEVGPEWQAKLDRIEAQARKARCALPPGFLRLLSSPERMEQFPSCTACYFDLSARLIPAPDGESGHFARFLNDQQGCAFWYLWLRPDRTHAVVWGSLLDTDAFGDEEWPAPPELHLCAPSFEVFLRRYWLENTLWFALNRGQPLSGELEHYARFYRQK